MDTQIPGLGKIPGRIRWNSGKWNPEFQSPVGCQVWSSGVWWNSGLVEPRVLDSVRIPGIKVRSAGEF